MNLPKYPIYVISKGRSDHCLTAKFLQRDGVPFRLVVEPQEAEAYAKVFGADLLRILPFSNLGLGSIPARNWVKDDATKEGHARHWILDDNMMGIWRRWKARKIPCEAGPAFSAIEDFVDRYENVAIAGMNYYMFAVNKQKMPPFYLNVHVYSCILILNAIPHRWRGRYNEDTDICLQVLSDGWCTILVNAFLAWKMTTMTMKGGNTDQLYQADGRLKMARSLERVWPYVVETKRRFNRPQHVIKNAWRHFDTPLKRKPGYENLTENDERGMKLVHVKEVKSPELRALLGDDK